MNHDIEDIQSLDNLLRSLYVILKNENLPEARFAIRTIGRMGNNIGIALSDEQASVSELFPLLKKDYKSMFLPKDGGLQGFYIQRVNIFNIKIHEIILSVNFQGRRISEIMSISIPASTIFRGVCKLVLQHRYKHLPDQRRSLHIYVMSSNLLCSTKNQTSLADV